MRAMEIRRSELILGGQKSGKSRRAEDLAAAWLAQSADRHAALIATAQADDDEMRARIARHRRDRVRRVPGLATLEAPRGLPGAISSAGGPETLRIVDCLTLWLTQRLLPLDATASEGDPDDGTPALVRAIGACPGPIVLVSNEIGWGVIPLGPDIRAFVDALGTLNQAIASVCERVTLMAAGLPLALKDRT
jgi:adenosylcobinamide kinase/adenosylcobinamide-phosphate guanylyltransferase